MRAVISPSLLAADQGRLVGPPQLAALIGREGSLHVIVHWCIDIFNDAGALHALSEHAVTNQSQEWWGPIGWLRMWRAW